MGDGFWFSAFLGLVIGGVYTLLVFASLRLAFGKANRSFMLFVFGGMALRLFLAVASIAIIIALIPVKKMIFLAAFFVVFLIALVIEIVILHRHIDSTKNASE